MLGVGMASGKLTEGQPRLGDDPEGLHEVGDGGIVKLADDPTSPPRVSQPGELGDPTLADRPILVSQDWVGMEQTQQITGQKGIAARQRGSIGEAVKDLIRGQVKGVVLAHAPQLFVSRNELRIQLADDLILVAKPVVQVPRADAGTSGYMVCRD